METRGPVRSSVGGRRLIVALGVVYVVVGVAWPLLQVAGDASPQEGLIITFLAGGSGVVLLVGGYRLPETDIQPEIYPSVASWCLRGLGLVGAILVAMMLLIDLVDPVANFLMLTGFGAVAGFVAGRHDARAKSRAYVLEQRNEELQETQAELEETVARLQQSEQRYRTVTENFPNGAVALLDTELRYTLVRGRGFERVHVSAGEIQGQRVQDAHSAELTEALLPRFRDTLAGDAATFEVEIGDRTFEFRTHPLTDDSDDVYAILAMSQDVTERKQRERELTRQARQQAVVAELGQLALEAEDLDELVVEASRRVADALDVSYCTVLDLDQSADRLRLRHGVGWEDGVVGEATVPASEGDSQAGYALAHDQPVVVEDVDAETRFTRSELLRSHDVQSGVCTVIGPFEDPWGVLSAHDSERRTFTEEDVSFVQSVANIVAAAIEREQYESELEGLVADLEASNERLEQFAHAASHDLQEPLRMVSTYLQLVERQYADVLDEDGREYLQFAVDGADRMRAMIDGLLQYSRVETRGGSFEPVDLDAVVSDVRDDLDVRIRESGAEITVDELPRVRGDEDQLRQVFQNLLENAIKYSGDDPPAVEISADRTGSEWTISVRDDGVGIDPADQEQVFDVFRRLHAHGEHEGSGIGLAVCERIVERHGGDIWVESTPGEGSTFSFTLPAVAERNAEATRAT